MFQFDVSTLHYPRYDPPAAAAAEPTELLRQLIELQKEQLAQLQAMTALLNSAIRWRMFLDRWRNDLPGLASACRRTVPHLERTFGQLLLELAEHLDEQGEEAFRSDFDLQEFLDRYASRLAQLGSILNAVAPLAEAGNSSDA
jgi:hypothetical protein